MEPLGSRQDVGIGTRINARKIWEQTQIALRLVISYFNWTQAAFVPGNEGGTASRVNRSSLDLESLCHLSHTFLRHDPLQPLVFSFQFNFPQSTATSCLSSSGDKTSSATRTGRCSAFWRSPIGSRRRRLYSGSPLLAGSKAR